MAVARGAASSQAPGSMLTYSLRPGGPTNCSSRTVPDPAQDNGLGRPEVFEHSGLTGSSRRPSGPRAQGPSSRGWAPLHSWQLPSALRPRSVASFVPTLTFRTLAFMITFAACLLLPACASDSEGARFIGPTFGTPKDTTVIADWDDVDAAVETGAGQAEMAVVFDETPSPDERVFYLRTIGDKPVKLTVTRTNSEAPPTIQLEVRAGVFGDPGDQARLLKAVSTRLSDLKGVEFAPVRQ